MKTLIIILVVILFILLIPLSVKVSYREQISVYFGIVWPVFKVFPLKTKKNRIKVSKKKKNRPAEKKNKPKKKLKPDLSMILDLIRRFPRCLKRLITVRKLEMNLLLGNSDPADLALTFGAVNAALESSLAILSPVFPVERWNIRTAVDFERDSSAFDGMLSAHTNIIRVLSVLFSLAYRVIIKKEVAKGD